MSYLEQADLDVYIAKACTRHEKLHWRDIDYRACVSIEGQYFVKFGSSKTLWPEIATHAYIYKNAQSQEDASRIPKVLFHFEDPERMYVVI